MDLKAADIDDAAAAAREVVAVAAPLDDVARVDESVGIEQRLRRITEIAKGRTRRTDAQRVIFDPEVDIAVGTRDKARWETGATVRHLEGDARLRRCERMRDLRRRKHGLDMIDHRLVRDFSRQARIYGR